MTRLQFFQSDDWERRRDRMQMGVYQHDRCCYCFRLTKPGTPLLRTARTNDGEWWLVSAEVDLSTEEFRHFQDQLDGTFVPTFLPIGPDCLRKHPEFRFALVQP